MQLREILDPRSVRSAIRWPFLVELQRGLGAAKPHVKDLVERPIVPLRRRDGVFGDVLVGRAGEAHVRLGSSSISHLHAIFRPFPDGTWQIVDRESTNGTFVNGVRLRAGVPVVLKEGAVIRLGARKFAFGSSRLQALLGRLMAS